MNSMQAIERIEKPEVILHRTLYTNPCTKSGRTLDAHKLSVAMHVCIYLLTCGDSNDRVSCVRGGTGKGESVHSWRWRQTVYTQTLMVGSDPIGVLQVQVELVAVGYGLKISEDVSCLELKWGLELVLIHIAAVPTTNSDLCPGHLPVCSGGHAPPDLKLCEGRGEPSPIGTKYPLGDCSIAGKVYARDQYLSRGHCVQFCVS